MAHEIGRGQDKLGYALDQFTLSVEGAVAVDVGASTGGFTAALLERGARKVYSVDTAYGQLDWQLRQDPRVVVVERTNALHYAPPETPDLVVIDAGWTIQKRIVPLALAWLPLGGSLVSLVKPHYEAKGYGIWLKGGRLQPAEAETVFRSVVTDLEKSGIHPKTGLKSAFPGAKKGNQEYFIWIIKE